MTGARRAAALAALVVVLAGVVVGLVRTTVDTRPESFVPEDTPAAEATAQAASSFGGDPVVVLLESDQPHGLTAGEQLSALLRLEGRLAGLPDVATVYGPATVLNQIAGRTQEMLGELTGRRDGLRIAAERAAIARGDAQEAVAAAGRSATAGFDARYGPLIVQGMPGGLPTTKNPRFVDHVLYGPGGQPNAQWRFVVPSDRSVAVHVRLREGADQPATERLVRDVQAAVGESGLQARATVSGVPVVASAMAGQVRYELPLLGGVAVVAVGAWFWFVPWTRRRHRLVPLLSTVVATALTLAGFGLVGRPLSLGTVAFLPVLLGIGSEFMTYLARGADRRTVVGVALAAGASFGSLALITPVRAIADLGLALGVGMVVAVGTSVATASLLGRTSGNLGGGSSPAGPPTPAPPTAGLAGSGKGRIAALVAVAAIAVGGWAALPTLPLRGDVQDFAAGTPAIADAEHVQQVVGSGAEVGVYVTGANVLTPESYMWMDRVRTEIVTRLGDRMFPVLSPPSLMSFLGPQPSQGEIDAAQRLLPPYLSAAVVKPDRTGAMLAFGVRMDSIEEIVQLRDETAAVLADMPPPAGTTATPTGLPLIAAAGYEAVSADRYLHNGIGILAAALVLLVALRRRSDVLYAVGASVLATGVGLALLWLAGVPLTPITVGLGSLTAAVGSEFAILLRTAAAAGDRALRRAVLLAAAASGTGYAVLVLSGLSVIAEFGVLLAISVGLAYGCAALLVGSHQPSGTPDATHPDLPENAPEPVGVR